MLSLPERSISTAERRTETRLLTLQKHGPDLKLVPAPPCYHRRANAGIQLAHHFFGLMSVGTRGKQREVRAGTTTGDGASEFRLPLFEQLADRAQQFIPGFTALLLVIAGEVLNLNQHEHATVLFTGLNHMRQAQVEPATVKQTGDQIHHGLFPDAAVRLHLLIKNGLQFYHHFIHGQHHPFQLTGFGNGLLYLPLTVRNGHGLTLHPFQRMKQHLQQHLQNHQTDH